MAGCITTMEGFLQWMRSEECPERGQGRFSWLAGLFYIEVPDEYTGTHNRVRTELTRVLDTLVREADLGLYLVDGVRLTCSEVGLSTRPDGLFISNDDLRCDKLRKGEDTHTRDIVTVEGCPTMVLEVVGSWSEEKDLNRLPELYYAAGIGEFWCIDSRADLHFKILRRTEQGYRPTQLSDGWWRSSAFHRDFFLMEGVDPLGQPRFTLQVRP